MKRTKIVCTIGPASETKTKLEQMVKAGLNVARLNFSHGKYEHHEMLIKNLRAASEKLNEPVAILQDLQGPRIRIGDVPEAGIAIRRGDVVALVPEKGAGRVSEVDHVIPIQLPTLYKDVKAGHHILVDDAKIQLEVTAVKNKVIFCKVEVGETINAHKGMNFPDSSIHTPPITEKDQQDLAFGISQNVDFVALSFVKEAKDVHNLRALIRKLELKHGRGITDKKTAQFRQTNTQIIAKIERAEAIDNFEAILQAADGIMVARGDLGLETPIQDLPLVQKKMIRRCIQESKPVIVATQMLDSMIKYPVPTRAEVSDVANAILDGTDAIMLSGETATGKYPLKAVQIMTKIAHQVESTEITDHEKIEGSLKKAGGITEAVTYAVQNVADDVNAKLIICVTQSGYTARTISKFRSRARVIAIAPTAKTRNQLSLSWGVRAYHIPTKHSFESFLTIIRKLLIKEKLVKAKDAVVIVYGHNFGDAGHANLIKVETI